PRAMHMPYNWGALDAQPVHQPHDHFHLIRKPVIVIESHHRVAKPEQVRRDDPITRRQKRNDVAPFERMERTPVKQKDWLAASLIYVGDAPGIHIDELLIL